MSFDTQEDIGGTLVLTPASAHGEAISEPLLRSSTQPLSPGPRYAVQQKMRKERKEIAEGK